jgi:hypothetical protein
MNPTHAYDCECEDCLRWTPEKQKAYDEIWVEGSKRRKREARKEQWKQSRKTYFWLLILVLNFALVAGAFGWFIGVPQSTPMKWKDSTG